MIRVPELPPDFETESFPRALFGYDRYTIVKRLEGVRGQFEELLRERDEQDGRIRDLELELARSREGQRLIGETLVSVQREARTIRESARREAQEVLRSARKQANRILEETELAARAKAKELVESAERERNELVQGAGRAKAFIEQTHDQLSDFLLAAVTWYEDTKPFNGQPEPERVDQPQAPPSSENEDSSIPVS